MAKRYFHSDIDGYRVKFTHEANYTNYTAFINGLAAMVYAKSLPEISGKVRKIIAAHTASLEVRHNTGQPVEVEIVNGQLEGVEFETDAQIFQNVPCETGLDKEWKWLEEAAANMGLAGLPSEFEPLSCQCSPCREETIAALRPFAKRQWFADYQNPNSEPQELQERAKELGISGSDWAEYHKRRAEAASQF